MKEKEIQKKELDREKEFEIKYLKKEVMSLEQVLQDAMQRESVNAERESQAQAREREINERIISQSKLIKSLQRIVSGKPLGCKEKRDAKLKWKQLKDPQIITRFSC